MLKKVVCAGMAVILAGTSAFAADYTVDAPSAGIFGKPTSVTTVYVADNVNKAEIDKSKTAALFLRHSEARQAI